MVGEVKETLYQLCNIYVYCILCFRGRSTFGVQILSLVSFVAIIFVDLLLIMSRENISYFTQSWKPIVTVLWSDSLASTLAEAYCFPQIPYISSEPLPPVCTPLCCCLIMYSASTQVFIPKSMLPPPCLFHLCLSNCL